MPSRQEQRLVHELFNRVAALEARLATLEQANKGVRKVNFRISTLVITFVVVAVLLLALGCGQHEAKPSDDLVERLGSIDAYTKIGAQELNHLRHDVEDNHDLLAHLRGELDVLGQRFCALEEKCRSCRCQGCCNAKDSVLTAKRLDALLDHSAAMSKVTAVYFHYATPDVCACLDDEAGIKMDAALAQAREVINRNAILFDLDFNIDSDRYFEVFRQMNRLRVTNWHEYRVFVAALTNSFDDICKERIARLEGGELKGVRMPLAALGYERRIGMKARQYLQAMREFWQDSQCEP